MEPEVSLSHSQSPATCVYPEPDQSPLCLSIPLLQDRKFNVRQNNN